MKYIKNRNQFLAINEADAGPMANDINWGDSLLGRLINTIARYPIFLKNSNDIGRILKSIEKEIQEIGISSIDEQALKEAKVSEILRQLYFFIQENNSFSKKVSIMNKVSEAISKIEEIGGYTQLIEDLEEFKDLLSDIEFTNPDNNENKEGDKEADKKEEEIIKKDTIIDPIIAKQVNSYEENNYFIYGEKTGLKLPIAIVKKDGVYIEGNKVNVSNIDKNNLAEYLIGQIDQIRLSIAGKEHKFDKKFYNKLTKYLLNDNISLSRLKNGDYIDVTINNNNDIIFTLKEKKDGKKQISVNIYDFLSIDNILPITQIAENISIRKGKKDYLIYESFNYDDVLSMYIDIVNPKSYYISQQEADELIRKSKDSKNIEANHKNIINILKLFNRAYKIYTTEKIPSSRSGGKVSQGRELLYDKIDDGNYRNKKLFNKFESGVLDLLRDYKDLFTEKVRVGKGDGRILLKFINELLSGDSKLYKKGAQYEFLNNYFGIDAKNLGGDIRPNKDKDKPKEEAKEETKINSIFKPVTNIKFSEGFYAIKDDDKCYYLFIKSTISKNDDKYYLGKITNNIDSYLDYVNVNNIDTDKYNLTPGHRSGNIPNGDLDIILFNFKGSVLNGYKQNIYTYLSNNNFNINDVKFDNFELFQLVDSKTDEKIKIKSDYNKNRTKSDISFSNVEIKDLLKELKNKFNLK